MSGPKKFLFAQEAREAIFKGIELSYKAIASTLGPYGQTVAIDKRMIVHNTKDGVTVANDVGAEDPWAEMGVKIVREASQNCNRDSGDGPQPLYSKVLTPHGFVKMGDIKVGDTICGTDGSSQKVIGVFPKGMKEIYEVQLHDGRIVECCKDHLWKGTTNEGRKKIQTTEQLIGKIITMQKNGHKQRKFYLPYVEVEFEEKSELLTLDPYFLGVLVGDGSLSGTGNIELSLGVKKEHILDKLKLPEGVTYKKKFVEERKYFRVTFDGNTILREHLQKLGLFGARSDTKFIPSCYVYSNKKTRESLLQGLIDTDGYMNNRGLFEYSTVSVQLASDFMELCRGLGMNLHTRLHTRNSDADSYSDKPIYRIQQLKGDKYGYSIESIRPTGKFTEMQCIKVSNPDNLYITDGYVVTHNTTTVVVIAYEMCKEWLTYGNRKLNTIKVKRGIKRATETAIKHIASMARKISTENEYGQVATLASQDQNIGKIVAKAFMESGKYGSIDIERNDRPGIIKEHTDGLSFDEGYLLTSCVNDLQNFQCVIENCAVLVTDKAVKTEFQLIPIVEQLIKSGQKRMLLIADTVEGEALGLIFNNLDKFLCCPVKAPSYGLNKMAIIRDICTVTGATLLSESNALRLEKATINDLGKAKKVIITHEKTVIVSEDTIERKKAISDRIDIIKSEIEQEPEDSIRKEELRKRLATLTDGITTLKVGSQTEGTRHEEKARVEDAVKAVRSASEEGVTPGGGTALLRCIPSVDALIKETSDEHERIGMQIVRKALSCSALKVLEVAGIEDREYIVAKVKDSKGWTGYDFDTGEIKDLGKLGVIDAAKVVRCALENASSVASTFVSMGVGMTHVEEASEFLQKAKQMFTGSGAR